MAPHESRYEYLVIGGKLRQRRQAEIAFDGVPLSARRILSTMIGLPCVNFVSSFHSFIFSTSFNLF
jgi:hypothetical protein